MVQTGTRFREGSVDADGFKIRYLEAGSGSPLVCLHGAGGLNTPPVMDLLAEQYRVIAFEMPGFGASALNDRSKSCQDLAHSLAQAATNLGLERYSLMGTSFGGRIAAWQALEAGDALEALVLVCPAAVLPENFSLPNGSPEKMEALMYAHPERRGAVTPPDQATVQKQQALIGRVSGLVKDPVLEEKLAEIQTPTLVLFGTRDGIIPPEMGRFYRAKMPNCHYVLVYDAAHAIASDRPEAMASVVLDFLERKEVFVVSRQSTLINP